MTDIARQIAELLEDHDANGLTDVLLSVAEFWSSAREGGSEQHLADVLTKLRIGIDKRRKSI